MQSVGNLLHISAGQLAEAGYIHGQKEAEIILAHLLNKDSAWILTHGEDPVEDEIVDRLEELVEERLKGQPLAYILGHQNFLGSNFQVDKRALIPRPETELLVENLIRLIRKNHIETGNFLEIGTGAGPIAISLKKYFPEATVTATDVSSEALELAEDNSRQLQVDVEFVVSDLLNQVPAGMYDLIVANLPYVPSTKLAFASDQILDWEPMVAIDGGEDGLKYIRPLIENIKPYLADKGVIALETWHTHGDEIKDLVAKHLPDYEVTIDKDLAGFDRFAIISPV